MSVSADRTHRDFAARLVDWQRRHGRHDLPWQLAPLKADYAYRVWVSEIMLQQTQVQTVIPYFHRFVDRFPNLQSLAKAHEQEVLALWSGLGYYQRGRNLLACAKTVARAYQGRFPQTAQELQQLPGIGPSTAAAIAAIVFRERAAILDGNVKRVLARQICAPQPWGSPALDRVLWQAATQRLPTRPDDMPVYTQAIMDLGATVCRAKNPRCADCPVQEFCQAYQQSQTASYPQPKKKKVIPVRQAYWCVLVNAQGVWLQQQPVSGIWPGLWVPWALDLAHPPPGWRQTARSLRQVITIGHSFSHYRLEIHAGILDWPLRQRRAMAPQGAPEGLVFFPWDQAITMALPAPVKKLLLRLCPSARASDAAPRRRNRI